MNTITTLSKYITYAFCALVVCLPIALIPLLVISFFPITLLLSIPAIFFEISHIAFYGVLVFFLVFCGLSLWWKFTATKLAMEKKPEDLKLSPWLSVFWYVVPIFSLWKPYVYMQRIHQVLLHQGHWKDAPTSRAVKWWWAFLILPIIFSIIAAVFNNSEDPSTLTLAFGTLVYVSCGAFFCLWVYLVRSLSKRCV